jgi:hypothetical protein
MAEHTPRKVAFIANCLLNQNAKVCQGAHYPGVVSPVVQALRVRGYVLQQLPCPELAFMVPLVYPRIIDLVSPKVGGFYYSPIFGWQYENYWLNR